MILHPLKRCACKETASYARSHDGTVIYYCETHAPADATPARQSCHICCVLLDTPLEHTCQTCLSTLASGKTTRRKVKENRVHDILACRFKISLYDARLPGGCSSKRPDFIIESEPDSIVVIEVDEHQHQRSTYSCECEITRMRQIYFDWGVEGGKMTFIRYNPDTYKPSYGVEFNQARREDWLIKLLHGYKTPERPGIYVIYLFYDGFTELNAEWEHAEPY